MKNVEISGPRFLLSLINNGFSQVVKHLTEEQLIKCQNLSLELNEWLEARVTNNYERLALCFAITGATMGALTDIQEAVQEEHKSKNVQEGNEKVN